MNYYPNYEDNDADGYMGMDRIGTGTDEAGIGMDDMSMDNMGMDDMGMDMDEMGMDETGMGMNRMGMDRTGMGMNRTGMGMDRMGMGGMPVTGQDYLLINDIQRAVILEVQAYYYYQRLITLTYVEQERQIIAGIQNDELRHYHWFTMMLSMLGVQQQPMIPLILLPTNYNYGLREAIRLETDAQIFYQSIADRATAPFIRMHTLHAISDERRHAALLQNILQRLETY